MKIQANFVLNGNLGKQDILVFRPKYDYKKKVLSYIYDETVVLKDEESSADSKDVLDF